MLKITESAGENGTASLNLEGRVSGAWLKEMKRCCDAALQRGSRVMLNLADVYFVDREAVAVFKELADNGVAIINCSPFVAEQLKEITPSPNHNPD